MPKCIIFIDKPSINYKVLLLILSNVVSSLRFNLTSIYKVISMKSTSNQI